MGDARGGGYSRKGFLLAAVSSVSALAAGCSRITSADIVADVAGIPGTPALLVRRLHGPDLVQIRADEKFPAASLAKLLILVAAIEYSQARPHGILSKMRVSKGDLVASSRLLHVAPGDVVPMHTLLTTMIESSDNLAANVIISNLTPERIDAVAKHCALKDTHIVGHYVDIATTSARAVTSARDVALLLSYITERARSEKARGVSSFWSFAMSRLLAQHDRGMIPAGLPAGVSVANKTGAIEGFRGDAAVVDPYGHSPLLIVALVKGILPNATFGSSGLTGYGVATLDIRRVAHDAYNVYA